MKKNIYPKKGGKIAAYSAMAGAFMATAANADAQIIYTDVTDFTGATGDLLSIDMDADSTSDFLLFANSNTAGNWSWVYAIGNLGSGYGGPSNMIAGYSGAILPYGSALDAGDLVGPALSFVSNSNNVGWLASMYSSVTYAPFANTGDKYLGVKFLSGGTLHYGWMRLSCTVAPVTYTIRDYAYEATANTPIIAGDGIPCATPPDIVSATSLGPTGEKLKWTAESGIDYYQVYYRPVGAPGWLKKKSTSNQKNITGLTCATDYQWKVRSNCAGTFSAFSATSTFTTAACRMDDMEDVTPEITLYPNPAADFMYIDITTEISNDMEVFVTDMSGRTISGLSFTNDEDMLVLDVAALPAGLYMLSVRQGDVTTTANFVKQ
ncbi:MAG: T9SS type A sorting domain-containing protein [Chitinophagales bacterium]|nr:T9SS type A sorting domain-containing protein [Bacteroidota bacterium]